MKIDIQDLISHSGLNEPLYPGKRLVKKYVVPGDHKSHCAVFDWLESDHLHIEVKAGLTGKTLEAKELRHYPVSYQAPTFVDIVFVDSKDTTEKDEDEDETSGTSGDGSGGLKMKAFSKVTQGKLPTAGEIKKFVVMGKELSKESFATAFENLKVQLSQAKIMAMDLMKGVSDVIKRATPGGGLSAKGDETIKYKYDAERTAPMFGGLTPT
jgi:hypothetical protein